ncbi:MAG: saccharopine dehydrogenase NADP-binding domain-containing protein [Deltaproteobacteria bacterium]|nr:saccharopine dehydrogenase NADP-binding domain-containing protein [Deltaproteobacteria bacterium]MCB9785301.1 saccharopine dehydrogenase NADP-binding domain-containing protein [Deltaproteobacteria bacterium]
MSQILLYGAYGYTGKLIVRHAAAEGVDLVCAGRDHGRLRAVAEPHGMECRTFGLDDPAAMDRELSGIGVVIHAAGPFSRTSKPMADACLRNGVHYTDITGEIEVFEALAARDGEARARGVMLMPGTGFDVVPSDCLAVHLARQLPDATHLGLAFAGLGGGISHGTAMTMVENLHRGGLVRRDGELVSVPTGSLTTEVDFGRGPRPAMAIPWGDVATAWRSTGIPNIEVYVPMSRAAIAGARLLGHLGGLLGSKPVQRLLKWQVERRPAGPSDAQRAGGKSILVGWVRDDAGATATARLTTPEGYTLTAHASLAIARRALAGDAPIGYQTPAMAYGPDIVASLGGSIEAP